MSKKWVDCAFEIGDTVYLKTDEDQKKRIVTSIWLKQTGLTYQVYCGIAESWHYDFELSMVSDLKLKTSE